MTVVTTPAAVMYAQRACHGSSWLSADEMTNSSNVAQPSSCTTFSTVGR